uniref:Ephrin RBD domain-containing protein n=2 Tax=Macrostomum lignano TaxID=282301 RepID=A0A1I8HTQ5_9PLAT
KNFCKRRKSAFEIIVLPTIKSQSMQLSNAVSGESRTEGDDERHQLQVRGAQQPEKYTEERRTSAVADSAAEPSYPDPDDDGNEFQFEGGRPTQPMPKRLILPLNISFLGLNLMFLLLSVEGNGFCCSQNLKDTTFPDSTIYQIH